MLTNLIALLVSLIFAASSFAADPSSISVSGTMANNESITISGANFGTKSSGDTDLFDNVEAKWSGSLSDGDSIPSADIDWGGDNVAKYETDNQRSANSVASYTSDLSVGTDRCYVNGFNTSGGNQLYISWWYRTDTITGKFLRVSESGDLENSTFSWGDAGSYIYDNSAYLICDQCSGAGTYWHDNGLTTNQWAFMEALFDATNDTWDLFVDGTSVAAATYIGGFTPDYVWKIGTDHNEYNGQVALLDDIYVDNSFARVMICTGSSWASRGQCDMQIISSWSDTSISATANQGARATNDTAYLYVINEAEEVNSSGYEVTIGGAEADTTAPTLSNGSPSGAQACTSDPRTITLECDTDESATCRFGASGAAWSAMAEMDTTGGTSHSHDVSLACDDTYTYDILCQDAAENESDPLDVDFSIAAEVVLSNKRLIVGGHKLVVGGYELVIQ